MKAHEHAEAMRGLYGAAGWAAIRATVGDLVDGIPNPGRILSRCLSLCHEQTTAATPMPLGDLLAALAERACPPKRKAQRRGRA